MPSAPVLSELDKAYIKMQLQKNCKKHWVAKGYKKTSVKELCFDANISIGTFYALYPAKEDLFLDTIVTVQERLSGQFTATCKKNQTVAGFCRAVKDLIRGYAELPFLYDFNSPDFLAFITKLPDGGFKQMKSSKLEYMRDVIKIANLRPKVSEEEVLGVLSALAGSIFAKDSVSLICDYFTALDFMVDNLIPCILEEAE